MIEQTTYYKQRLNALNDRMLVLHPRLAYAWCRVQQINALQQRTPAHYPLAQVVQQRMAFIHHRAAQLELEYRLLMRADQALQGELDDSFDDDTV